MTAFKTGDYVEYDRGAMKMHGTIVAINEGEVRFASGDEAAIEHVIRKVKLVPVTEGAVRRAVVVDA